MKLKIDEYEVQITAGRNGKRNEADTRAFLNLISCFAYEAKDMYNERKCPWCAAEAKRIADDIHNALNAKGFYDSIKIETI